MSVFGMLSSTTGLTSTFEYLNIEAEQLAVLIHNYTGLITSPQLRASLHVGNQPFFFANPIVQGKMMQNFMTSVKDLLEELLDTGNYRVLILSGDLDLNVGHTGIQDLALSLKWNGNDEYLGKEKQVWKDDKGKYAGNYQSAKGILTYALIHNAGHGVGMTKGDNAVGLIKGFVNGEIGGMKRFSNNVRREEL